MRNNEETTESNQFNVLLKHPFLWAAIVMLAVSLTGGLGGVWGFAAGVLATIALRESRDPNDKDQAQNGRA